MKVSFDPFCFKLAGSTKCVFYIQNFDAKSDGYVKLASVHHVPKGYYTNDMIINPNYYAEQEDVDNMVDVFKWGFALLNTPTYKAIGAKLLGNDFSQVCLNHVSVSEEWILCVVRSYFHTSAHFCCSVKIENDSNPMAVLTPDLRVRGFQSFGIVDAGKNQG